MLAGIRSSTLGSTAIWELKAAILRAAAIALGKDSDASFSSKSDCRCRLLGST